jgi:hypothetical protein
MKIHGNDITIHRGETFTLSMNVKMRDGTPFIMTYDPNNKAAHNPHILITIASSKYVQKGSYVKNWWLPMSDETPSFTSTEIKTLTGLDHTPSDGVNERYLYYNQQDGKYYYYDNGFKEYAFKIHKAFLHEDTNALVSQSYYYSVTYVDGVVGLGAVIAYMREDWSEITKDVTNLDIDTYFLKFGYDATKLIYLSMCNLNYKDDEVKVKEKRDTIEKLENSFDNSYADFTQVTPIVSPSKLTVLSNLRGGL